METIKIETDNKKTINWYEIVDENINISTPEYYTDIFSPWETKEQLRIWYEVKGEVITPNKYCLVSLSSANIPNSSTTTLAISSYTDNDVWMEYWSNKVKITSNWIYTISFWWYYEAATSNYWRILIVNNTNPISQLTLPASNDTTRLMAHYTWYFNVNDLLEFKCEQNTWSSRVFAPTYCTVAQIQAL